MHVKEKGSSSGVSVLLVCSVTVTVLSSLVRSGPAPPPPLTRHNVSNAAGTGKRPPSTGEDRSGHTHTPAAGLSAGDPADLHGGRPGQTRRSPRPHPPPLDCGEGTITVKTPGKFYIVGKLEPNVPDSEFQSDSAPSVQAEGQMKTTGGGLRSSSEQSWQKLQPVVECGGDSMILQASRRRAGHLLLGGVNESSVLLTQLTPDCGYDVQTTSRLLSLVAQYDACHVTQEADSYVLPLLWRGLTVKMSCPVPQLQPAVTDLFSVCCSAQSLMVQLRGLTPAEELKINVRGQWLPLVVLADQCGYSVDRRHSETVISAPYLTCGMSVKDGKHTLHLQLKEHTLTLSCPVSPPQGPALTPQPHVDTPQHLHRKSKTLVPGNMESPQWATPVYLAPLYYPHPTYHHTPPRPSVDPPTPSPLTPEPHPVVDPQPGFTDFYSSQIPIRDVRVHKVRRPPDDLEDSALVPPPDRDHDQVQAPPPQPPGHTFSPYYQYYHHSKIPLSGPQPPDPRPEVQEELFSNIPHHPYNIPVLPLNVQQTAIDSEQLTEPGTVPEVGREEALARGPSWPHLHHFFYYIPYILKSEDQDVATASSHLHRRSPSDDGSGSDGQTKRSLLPDVGGPNPGSGDQQKPPPSDPHSVDSSPHHLFYHPSDQRHHQVGHGPVQLDQTNTKVWSPEAADRRLLQTAPRSTQHPHDGKLQHFNISAESEPTYETETNLQLPNYPHYYYYYPVYEPQASADEPEPEGFKSKTQFPADSGHSSVDTEVSSDAPAFPSIPGPQHSALSGLHVPYIEPGRQLNYPEGEGTEGRLGEELPDCPLQQYLVFVLPYPVMEPILTLQSPEGGDVPFDLQLLTSDLGNVVRPVDVHEQELDVPVTCSPQKEGAPPVFSWMMGCSSPLDPSVGASLGVKDEPSPPPLPQTTPPLMAVEMRVATNELFSSFYPEAPLPLSLIQGRPLHLEVRLLDPPDPDLVLLVQSCLAVSPAPRPTWIPIYDTCSSWSDSRLLPSTNHIRRITISNFLFPTPESPSHTAEGEYSPPSDAEIHFSCAAIICSAADSGCTVGCNNSPAASHEQ